MKEYDFGMVQYMYAPKERYTFQMIMKDDEKYLCYTLYSKFKKRKVLGTTKIRRSNGKEYIGYITPNCGILVPVDTAPTWLMME